MSHDRETHDRQYLSAHWPGVGDPAAVLERWTALGEAFHGRARVSAELAYGERPRERLDLIRPEGGDAPVLVFLHGGYWRNTQITKRSCSFCIEPLVAAGALVAMVEYDLCPAVTVDDIVAQVRSACAWVWRHAGQHGGDPDRLHVAGHSAGGQLTAMLAATDWPGLDAALPADLVKSAVPISGIFDLEPLRLSSLNEDLHLDAPTAARNSPIHLAPATDLPVSIFVGQAESDGFREQSRDFARAWGPQVSTLAHQEVDGGNHFTILEGMMATDDPVTSALLGHLGL